MSFFMKARVPSETWPPGIKREKKGGEGGITPCRRQRLERGESRGGEKGRDESAFSPAS